MYISDPLVSIVIATWDRLPDLKKCISSVLNQTYQNIEIIIVDNNSSDGTFIFCEELSNICNLKYFSVFNFSAIEALNSGYKKSSGEFILTLDDDAELVDRKTIEKSVKLMIDNPQWFVIAYRVITDNCIDELEYSMIHNMRCVTEFFGAGFFARSDIFENLGYFDETLGIYGNELDISIESYIHGYSVIYLHNEQILHHRIKDSIYSGKKAKYMLKNSLNAPLKYFNFKHRLCMILGYGIGHIYYLLFKIKNMYTFLWWICWYPKVMIFGILHRCKYVAPLWIQDYYCKRMFEMLRGAR